MRSADSTYVFVARTCDVVAHIYSLRLSSSQDIVADYALSEAPLIIRITATDFMTRGAAIDWLSMYPEEKEVLFPPLTYLRPVGEPVAEDDGSSITVHPRF